VHRVVLYGGGYIETRLFESQAHSARACKQVHAEWSDFFPHENLLSLPLSSLRYSRSLKPLKNGAGRRRVAQGRGMRAAARFGIIAGAITPAYTALSAAG